MLYDLVFNILEPRGGFPLLLFKLSTRIKWTLLNNQCSSLVAVKKSQQKGIVFWITSCRVCKTIAWKVDYQASQLLYLPPLLLQLQTLLSRLNAASSVQISLHPNPGYLYPSTFLETARNYGYFRIPVNCTFPCYPKPFHQKLLKRQGLLFHFFWMNPNPGLIISRKREGLF